MKISLCLPTFGRFKMLRDCLISIEQQTYKDYEVIVKDGDVVDYALEGLYQINDLILAGRGKYILSLDDGIFPALNEAMRHATGDIFHFICSDDKLGDKDSLAAVAAAFSDLDTSEPCWAYGITGGMDKDGVRSDHLSGDLVTWEQYMQQRGGIGQPAVFWSRGMYRTLGGFDVSYKHAADFDYWCRCWLVKQPIFIPQLLGIGRKWAEASSTIHSTEVEEEAADIQKRYWK